jgi:hypothetical protein
MQDVVDEIILNHSSKMDTKARDKKGYEYCLLVNNVMAMLANDDLNARADYLEAVHSQQKKRNWWLKDSKKACFRFWGRTHEWQWNQCGWSQEKSSWKWWWTIQQEEKIANDKTNKDDPNKEMIDKDRDETNNDENDEDKLDKNMKEKEKETSKANPDKDKNKPDQDMKDKLDKDTNDVDKPDEHMKEKEKETNKDKSDRDNDETDKDEPGKDKDESDEEMNDRDDKDKDQPDLTMTNGQKNLMVTYKLNTMDKSPKMLRHAYTYKTTNDGKRNDLIQNHHEFASLLMKVSLSTNKHLLTFLKTITLPSIRLTTNLKNGFWLNPRINNYPIIVHMMNYYILKTPKQLTHNSATMRQKSTHALKH